MQYAVFLSIFTLMKFSLSAALFKSYLFLSLLGKNSSDTHKSYPLVKLLKTSLNV